MQKKWLKFLPALLGAVLYFTTFNHGLVLDDNLVITNHQYVQEGFSGIVDILKTNYANGGSGFNDGLYRPLSLVTFAIEKSLFNLNSSISHLINALLYGGLIWLIQLVANRLFRNNALAWAVAILFAVHPIHTEVVANLKGRDEILALLFFLWSLKWFDEWLETKTNSSTLLVIFFYALALLSKESAFTFLAVFPLYAWFKTGNFKRSLIGTGLAAAVIGPYLLLRGYVLSNMGPVDSGVTGLLQNPLTVEGGMIERLATGANIQMLYFSKLFVPVNLSHDYSYNAISVVGFDNISALLGASLIACFVALGVFGLIKKELYGFGILFYFITISAVSNVFILIGAMAAERFVFAPSLGWCIVLVYLGDRFIKTEKAQKIALTLMVVVFANLTVLRALEWKDNYTLYAADIDVVTESARAHYNLGTAQNEKARTSPKEAVKLRNEAIKHLKRAIEIYPGYQDAYNNMGIVYLEGGRFKESVAILQELLKKYPNYSKGLYNLAVSAFNDQQYKLAEEAAINYNRLAAKAHPEMLFIAGESAGFQNKMQDAISYMNQLIALEPNKPRGYIKLGLANAMTGNPLKGIEYLENALRLRPSDSETWTNLALMYSNTGQAEKAMNAVNQALIYNPQNQGAIDLKNQLNQNF